MSYRQQAEDGVKDIIFLLNFSLLPAARTQLFHIVKGQPSGNAALEAAYQDPVDRIIFGLLDQTALAAPICTEFNYLKSSNDIFGLWVRSPEAFNDPKMPLSELKSTVRLLLPNGTEVPTDKAFSRDGSQIFLASASGGALPFTGLQVEFKYKLWNPMTNVYETVTYQLKNPSTGMYETKNSVTTDVLPVPVA